MKAIDLSTVGKRVVFAREKLELKQAELARRIGFSQPSVSDLENDRTKEVSAKLLDAVARALGVSWDYLLHGKSAQTSSEDAIAEAELVGSFRALDSTSKVSLLDFARHLATKQTANSAQRSGAAQQQTNAPNSGTVDPPVGPYSTPTGGLFDVQVGGKRSGSAVGKPRPAPKPRRSRDT